MKTLALLPFVHRFDILARNGVKYLIACTLKSDHEYKDDWRFCGKVYAGILPDDLSGFDGEHPLKLDMGRNNRLPTTPFVAGYGNQFWDEARFWVFRIIHKNDIIA